MFNKDSFVVIRAVSVTSTKALFALNLFPNCFPGLVDKWLHTIIQYLLSFLYNQQKQKLKACIKYYCEYEVSDIELKKHGG